MKKILFVLGLIGLAVSMSAMADVKEEKQLASFRKSLAEGDDTSCGLVIEKKAKLAKIQIKSSNNEQWMKLDEIFPVGQSCSIAPNPASKVVLEAPKPTITACPSDSDLKRMETIMNAKAEYCYSEHFRWDSANNNCLVGPTAMMHYYWDKSPDCSKLRLRMKVLFPRGYGTDRDEEISDGIIH